MFYGFAAILVSRRHDWHVVFSLGLYCWLFVMVSLLTLTFFLLFYNIYTRYTYMYNIVCVCESVPCFTIAICNTCYILFPLVRDSFYIDHTFNYTSYLSFLHPHVIMMIIFILLSFLCSRSYKIPNIIKNQNHGFD